MARLLVLVTEHEYRKAEEVFRSAEAFDCRVAPWEESGLAEMIAATGARHVILGHFPCRGPLYDALEPGSLIARFGVGYDNLDLEKARARGIVCTNTPDVLSQSVAEHAMLLVAAAARRLPVASRELASTRWAPPVGVELAGKTLAIVGYGRIGAATARIAAPGYGMKIVGYRRSPSGPASLDGVTVPLTNDFGAAVRDAHFISLHLPASPATRHFINTDRLALMRRDAWFVNTARGAVVDEGALYDALSTGRLAGASLDVFEREPYVPADPSRDLRQLPNVVLTPHIGSHTTEANHAMGRRALQNVELAVSGRFGEMDRIA